MTTSRSVKDSIVEIKQLGPEDWAIYRALRLRALQEAPHAFGSTAADAARLSDEEWKRRLASRTTFAAVAEAAVLGLVSGIAAEQPAEAELISMWVDPDWRRQGVGARLVQAVVDWAVAEGFERLRLWVAAGNRPAERLYARLGFAPTGEVQPMGSRGSAMELAMVKRLP